MQNYIREHRVRLNITQANLASQVGIHRSQLSKIEHVHYNPSLRLALKISVILQVTVNELFQLESKDWELQITD